MHWIKPCFEHRTCLKTKNCTWNRLFLCNVLNLSASVMQRNRLPSRERAAERIHWWLQKWDSWHEEKGIAWGSVGECSEQRFKPRQMLPGNLQAHLKAIRAFQDFYLSLQGVNDVPCPCGSRQMCKALPRKATLSSQESGKSRICLSWNKTSPAQTHCPALTPVLRGSGSAPQHCQQGINGNYWAWKGL